MRGSLVIGIGNPLRGDDGVAWRLVEELEASGSLAAGMLRRVQQLTPELAEELAGVERVLFVDAWLAPAGADPCLRQVERGEDGAAGSHSLAPGALLAMAALLYGHRPEAAQLLVPAFSFVHGEALSAGTRAWLPMAGRLLRRWLAGASAQAVSANRMLGARNVPRGGEWSASSPRPIG